jgi:hypothetical protein
MNASSRANSRADERRAPGQRAQPREQLRERERLGQVVVGALVEAAHAVGHPIAGGEHDDRDPDPRLAEPAADLEPVHVRQPHVEDDGVELDRPRERDSLLASNGDVDDDPLAAQGAADGRAHAHVVLHEQHPHGEIIARRG